MGKRRIITELQLRDMLNKHADRLARSIEDGQKELTEKGLENLSTLEEVAKKGPSGPKK